MDHRISNQYFHHSFALNVNTNDIWGSHKYKFITNSLGFKDKINRNIVKENKFKRVIFIGDSFTEGIGYRYEDTFVGLIDHALQNTQTEVLNAGVASQSPILYLLKIKYLIEELKINFDELIVFLDISDIPDEVYYKREFLEKNNTRKLDKIIGKFLLKNFSSILFYNLISDYLQKVKKNLELKYMAANEFGISFFRINNDQVSFYKSINVERGNWTHNENLWKLHGKKGRELAKKNLQKLLDICEKNNIKMSLAIYPWPSQIYYNSNSSYHRTFWKNWANANKINFYDFFDYFIKKNKKEIIKEYFINGDIHWNEKGHRYISSIFIEEYFKKNN